MKLPESIKRLIADLSELPSIGPRQATRMAFFLAVRGENDVAEFAKNLNDLRKVKLCERCFFVHENADTICDICRDPGRNQKIVMIVEKETDLLSLENTGRFKGRYFILGPIPKIGVLTDYQKLRLQTLKTFVEKELSGKAEEIILGFNPTSVGDWNASLITKELAPLTKKISRLGRGLPTGGEIEFADEETLGSALDARL